MKRAPVLISVYNRFKHLDLCLKNLRKCRGAKQTVLYIVSDAAAKPEDIEAVQKVRRLIRREKGFQKIYPILQRKNQGFPKNIDIAIKKIFKKSNSLIFLEDDICVGKGFLEFVNLALKKYEKVPEVRFVCGWSWARTSNEKNTHYFLRGFSAWGAGIWREKMIPFDEIGKIGLKFFNSLYLLLKANKIMPNTIDFITRIAVQKKPIYDIACSLWLIKNNYFSVFPSKNLVTNIGHDGTGLHCTWAPWVENQIKSNSSYSKLSNLKIQEEKKHRNASVKFLKSKTLREILRQYGPALPFFRVWLSLKKTFHR